MPKKEPPESPKFSWSVWRELLHNSARIMRIVWASKKTMVIGMVLVFIFVSAAPFIQSGSRGLLINELVRTAGNGVVTSQLVVLIAVLILAGIIPTFLYTVQAYFSRLFYFFLGEKFEILIIERLGEIDAAIHEDPKKNDLFNKVRENGVWRVQNFVDRQFYIVQNIFEVLIASIILLSAQWWVFVIVLIGTLPELITEVRYGNEVWGMHGARAEVRRRYWSLRRHFDWLNSLIELKLFQNTKHFVSIIATLLHDFQNDQAKADRSKLIRQIGGLVLSQATLAFAAVWFIVQVVQGHILIGTLTFLLASIADLRQALSGLFANFGKQYADNLFITDLFNLLDLPPVIEKPLHPSTLAKATTPEIVFDNVSFGYPGTESPVLKNITLTIRPGEKLAIVGVNGAGKTTLIKLLCRFYDPTEGRILINGIDLRALDLNSWYAQLGILFQDYDHYDMPVREAIAIGQTSKPPSLPRIEAAAQASEAHEFISAWDHGYDQMLGKQFTGGIEPSIGQWQKLALARTFYRDPRIFVLDEPTSSIDAEAEAKIFEKLERLPNDRTVILISHRFSTVRHAHTIVVIEDGTISERGTHEQLVKDKKTYARLFALQAKGYQ